VLDHCTLTHQAIISVEKINFTSYSAKLLSYDQFFGKKHFCSSKIGKIRAYFRNLSKFHEKIDKICKKIFEMGLIHNRGLKTIQ